MNAPLTAKDFATDQEVRWCPGCGDYAILKCVQKTLADVQRRPRPDGVRLRHRLLLALSLLHERLWLPYDPRARASFCDQGLKLANPDLDVWLVTGDGDGLSIGGNHLLACSSAAIIDAQILLFNNEIYGLTKGQYSPTSRPGTRSPSTPAGSVDCAGLARRVCARRERPHFIARGIDTDAKNLSPVLKAAREFKGAAFRRDLPELHRL